MLTDSARPLVRLPWYRTLPALARDPIGALLRTARAHDRQVIRLDLGAFRPFLVTDPDHVQHVLRERPEVYRREGMLWRPLQRLDGDGIAGEGPDWADSRGLIQPMFTVRAVNGLLDQMALAIDTAVDELSVRTGQPLDVAVEMTRILHSALVRAFFGDRVSAPEAAELGHAISGAMTTLGPRLLLPFVPDGVPLPGDRRFLRHVRAVDAILIPHIARARVEEPAHADIVSLLARARGRDGAPLPDRRVRDDVVAMFVAATESTGPTLTWFWLLMRQYPSVAGELAAEARTATGPADLVRTRMALRETMRLYPVGWLIPRAVRQPDTLAGVRLRPGQTVIASPYLTQRLDRLWPDPDRFDLERFAEGGAAERRHRYAYFPFGGGPHTCLGSHLFMVEAQLVVAAMLRRFRVRIDGPVPVSPRPGASLRPSGRPRMVLEPAR